MKKKNLKISYDQKSRVLVVELEKGESVDSDIQGNVVIDYDKNGGIVRINLYDFSFDSFRENKKDLKDFTRHSGVLLGAR